MAQPIIVQEEESYTPSNQNEKTLLDRLTQKSIGELQKDNLLIYPKDLFYLGKDILNKKICKDSNGKYKFNDIIGFIGGCGISLTIKSKFSKSEDSDYFLHYLIQKICGINLFDLKHQTSEDEGFNLLPYFFPAYLKSALRQGIFKQYQTFRYNDSNVKGTIDVPRHIKLNTPFIGNVAYKIREFSYNNPTTQLIRHTIEYIRSTSFSPILYNDTDTISCIRQICAATPTYKLQDRQSVISSNLRPARHPYFTEYWPLQKLCLAILNHNNVIYGKNNDAIHGMLISGSWIWEEYLNKVLIKEFRHPDSYKQEGGDFLLDGEKSRPGKYILIYPDFISLKNPKLICDAKYIDLKEKIKNFEVIQSSPNTLTYKEIPTKIDNQEERINNIYYKTIVYLCKYNSHIGVLLYPYLGDNFNIEEFMINDFMKIVQLGIPIPINISSFNQFRNTMEKTEQELLLKLQSFQKKVQKISSSKNRKS